MKGAVKRVFIGLACAAAFPLALLAGFGRFRTAFKLGSHSCALAPGIPGDYLRLGYYLLTLRACSAHSRVSFGTIFSTPNVVLEDGVYIGAFCVIGNSVIGARTQIADHVQVLSGARQHPRGPDGTIGSAEHGVFERLTIGQDCWIGAAAVVMAGVGRRSTIGAGAIVTRDIPEGVVAAGNPARILRASVPAEAALASTGGPETAG